MLTSTDMTVMCVFSQITPELINTRASFTSDRYTRENDHTRSSCVYLTFMELCEFLIKTYSEAYECMNQSLTEDMLIYP